MAKNINYRKKQSSGKTAFEQRWGIHATDFATQENTTPDAIHMRVMRFGTPFQRKSKPTVCEIRHGKTVARIAGELDMHPVSIQERLRIHGDAYYKSNYSHSRGCRGDHRYKDVEWLHPKHPDYATWRENYAQ
tara:strand:- start:114 stop:512 length:399 start_codon:yes stop_codon:yes gene_type:complete